MAVAPPPPGATKKSTLRTGKPKKEFLPPWILLYAVEGWGKTTCATQLPKPLMIQCGETGYETLYGAGQVQEIDIALSENGGTGIESWSDLLAILDGVAEGDHDYKSVVLDSIAGAEHLCHRHVCNKCFNGNWGEGDKTGFTAFSRGFDISVTEWEIMLNKFERISKRGLMVMLLGHVIVKPYQNPVGENFDRFIGNVHPKTWGATFRRVDASLFGNFVIEAEKKRGELKAKGKGGDLRRVYCTRSDAYDAKNRYGMPTAIDIPNDPSQIWSTIWQHIRPKG